MNVRVRAGGLRIPAAYFSATAILTHATILLALLTALAPRGAADVSFVRDVAPIIVRRCTGCHGERMNAGGYRASSFELLMKPGASGLPPIVPGVPSKSRLFHLITAPTAMERMPQADDPLTAAQVATIRGWIAGGARFDAADRTAPLRSLGGPRVHPLAPTAYRAAVPIAAIALAPGGRELYAGGYNEVTVWNPDTGELIRRLQRLPQRIQALAPSPNGERLLVAGGTPGEYGEVVLVDPRTGPRVTVLDTEGDIVLSAAFNHDGTRIAAGGADGTVRVYDSSTGARL